MSAAPAIIILGPSGLATARRAAAALPGAELHGLAKRVGEADVYFDDTARHLGALFVAGRPIVATDVGPSREIIGDRAGLLIPPGDLTATVGAMRQLLESPTPRETMGQAGRLRARRHFDMEQQVRKVTRLYEQVAGR